MTPPDPRDIRLEPGPNQRQQEPRGGERMELTSANEVLTLIQSDDVVIQAAKRFGLVDGALIEFAYTLIGDRKDRRHTAPSASGGEAIAWTDAYNLSGLKTKRGGWTMWPNDHGKTSIPLFAHPARMPTRAEIDAILQGAVEEDEYPKSAHRFFQSDDSHGDRERAVNAILALFHTGETKGDGA